jgi:hypothetical protein
MNMCDGYIVSFPVGGRGRFIIGLTHQLTSTDDPILPGYTKYNSAHNTPELSYIRHMFTVDGFSLNREENTYGATEIISTHCFPSIDWSNNEYLKNKKIILITVENRDIPEIIANSVLKNIFPRLEMESHGVPLNSREQNFMGFYKKLFLNKYQITLDLSVLTDPVKTEQVLRAALTEPHFVNATDPSFIVEQSSPDKEGVLNIKYNEMFDQTDNGEYKMIDILKNFTNSNYNGTKVHEAYADYAQSRFDVFKTYCPWFLEENK